MERAGQEDIKLIDLRRRAEQYLAEHTGNPGEVLVADMQALLHELQVHKIELKMQNEELRRSQEEIETVRDRYIDLYDFTPVGYVTLSEKGIVTDANLTAAVLLGVERSQLVGQPFSHFILADDQDGFYLHRRAVLESLNRQSCTLRML